MHTHTCIHAYTHTNAYVWTHRCVYTHMHVHVYIAMHVHVHACTHVYTCVCTYLHVYMARFNRNQNSDIICGLCHTSSLLSASMYFSLQALVEKFLASHILL